MVFIFVGAMFLIIINTIEWVKKQCDVITTLIQKQPYKSKIIFDQVGKEGLDRYTVSTPLLFSHKTVARK
jgi:hypothetical protein